MGPIRTTNLLSNATDILLKAMKICYGQLSDQPFHQKFDFFYSIITVLDRLVKVQMTRFVMSFYIRSSLYPVNLTLTK